MIPDAKKRDKALNELLWLEDWITNKMRIEKIQGIYSPKKKKL